MFLYEMVRYQDIRHRLILLSLYPHMLNKVNYAWKLMIDHLYRGMRDFDVFCDFLQLS